MSSSAVYDDPLQEAIRTTSIISEEQPLRFWDGRKCITITRAMIDPEKDLEHLHNLTAGVWEGDQEDLQ